MAPSPSPMFDLPAMLINLDRAPDRLAFMEKQFAEHGVRYERFPAVDGAAVAGDPAAVVEGCAVEYCAPADFGIERERWCREGKKLRVGEIGCVLSHLACIKRVYEANEHEAVVVVEDDISLEFVPKWTRSLGDIARADGWGIVKISCNHPAGVRNLLKMDEGLVPFKRHYWSTGMYIINRRGMKLVLDKYCAGAAFRVINDSACGAADYASTPAFRRRSSVRTRASRRRSTTSTTASCTRCRSCARRRSSRRCTTRTRSTRTTARRRRPRSSATSTRPRTCRPLCGHQPLVWDVRPNFEILERGQIEVDSADFGTDRSRRVLEARPKSLVRTVRLLGVGWKI